QPREQFVQPLANRAKFGGHGPRRETRLQFSGVDRGGLVGDPIQWRQSASHGPSNQSQRAEQGPAACEQERREERSQRAFQSAPVGSNHQAQFQIRVVMPALFGSRNKQQADGSSGSIFEQRVFAGTKVDGLAGTGHGFLPEINFQITDRQTGILAPVTSS